MNNQTRLCEITLAEPCLYFSKAQTDPWYFPIAFKNQGNTVVRLLR